MIPVIPMRYFSTQEVLFTLVTSHGGDYLLQSLLLQRMCVLYMFQVRGGKLDPSRDGVVEEKCIWIMMSQANTPAFDGASLQAWLLPLLRLFHAGGLHRRAGEGTVTATSLRGAAMEELRGSPA